MNWFKFYVSTGLLFCAVLALGQSDINKKLIDFNEKRLQITRNGMYVLGVWAGTNLLLGGIGASQTTGATRYFYQGNALWNTVNAGLAGFSLWQISQTDPSSLSLLESIQEQQKIEHLLLFNAGLDIAYIASGWGLTEYGSRSKNPDLFNGYGRALIVQGSFLLLFDSILYFILHKHQMDHLPELLGRIGPSSTGIGITLNL